MTLHHLPEQGEGARSDLRLPGARHSFVASPNPRTTSCVKCGRQKQDTVHEYSELAHRTSVAAHFQRASKLIGEGEWALAEAEGKAALRILKEDG